MATPDPQGRRIWKVTITRSCANQIIGPPTPLTARLLSGRTYVTLQVLGYTDRKLATYCLAYLDEMFDSIPRPWQECVKG